MPENRDTAALLLGLDVDVVCGVFRLRGGDDEVRCVSGKSRVCSTMLLSC